MIKRFSKILEYFVSSAQRIRLEELSSNENP